MPVVLLLAANAMAQEDKKTDEDKPADPDTGESTVKEKTLGLLPNPLQKYGVKFAATYISEVLGNASGGLKQGAIYEGRLNLTVDVDLQKLVGFDKLTFHANMFQIHGDGLSRSNLQNFFVVSGIEALPSTRLYEAYFERQWGAKKVSLKFGQLAADSEFFNVGTGSSAAAPTSPRGTARLPMSVYEVRSKLQVLAPGWRLHSRVPNADASRRRNNTP
ncbi:carbohydrate porin [Bradyrhizobium sp. 186]|uniref:carbohydrate porin n=1 Tax=Bradyrhizobium sp. 186 TaxID=2782654 RepID=UPI0020010A78|nr:carbohydrate porin [Bradyrhizobium sp. 186]